MAIKNGDKLIIKVGCQTLAATTSLEINPLAIMTEKQLVQEMNEAILNENYEYCAEIRDYLSQREI